MDKLGTQCSAFGCSRRKKSVKNKGELCRSESEGVQMKNLDRNESFLGHFIHKCLDKICQLCKATFFSYYSILQLKFAILLNLPCFFQVESGENFSKFCLKGCVAKMAEKKILCMPCCKALGSVNCQAESIFLKLKDRGSLFKPTQSVITICEETENVLNE